MAQTLSLLGNWHPQGHKYGHRMVCDSGLPLSTKVKDDICNGNWKWENARQNQLAEVKIGGLSIPINKFK